MILEGTFFLITELHASCCVSILLVILQNKLFSLDRREMRSTKTINFLFRSMMSSTVIKQLSVSARQFRNEVRSSPRTSSERFTDAVICFILNFKLKCTLNVYGRGQDASCLFVSVCIFWSNLLNADGYFSFLIWLCSLKPYRHFHEDIDHTSTTTLCVSLEETSWKLHAIFFWAG